MDFGYPQNLSPEILKLYITQEGVRSPFSSKVEASIRLCILQILELCWCVVLWSEAVFPARNRDYVASSLIRLH